MSKEGGVPDFLALDDPAPPAPGPRVHESHRGSTPVPPGTPETGIDTNMSQPNFPGSENGGGQNSHTQSILATPNITHPTSIVEALKAEEDPYFDTLPSELKAFLRVLEKCGMPSRAADVAGVPRGSMYRKRKNDPEFKRLWDEAKRHRNELIEDEALRRAVHGVEEPVFYMGAICGYKRVYSDSLLSKLLEGNMPEKYRTNHKVEVEGQVGLATLVLPAQTSAEEWVAQNNGVVIDQLPESDYD